MFRAKELQPGESVSLKCLATGTPIPQITWYLDELPISDIDGIRHGDFVTKQSNVASFVNISNVETVFGGEWSCLAKNEIGHIRYSAMLTVYGPPVVRSMPNLTVAAHETLRFKCPVGGIYEEITWEKSK